MAAPLSETTRPGPDHPTRDPSRPSPFSVVETDVDDLSLHRLLEYENLSDDLSDRRAVFLCTRSHASDHEAPDRLDRRPTGLFHPTGGRGDPGSVVPTPRHVPPVGQNTPSSATETLGPTHIP